MSEWRITFRCRLLEDMHAGSGLGFRGLVDDRHARDAKGRPVLADNALSGLLRDIAEELRDLEHPQATPERILRLFGQEGAGGRSALVARSLRFEWPRESQSNQEASHAANRPMFLAVTRTARQVYSRRPMEQTLRTIELSAAGLEAAGEIRLVGDTEDKEFLLLCLRRLRAIGGEKSRGTGQIQLHQINATEAPTLKEPELPREGPGPFRLRLLLRLLEPVCLPKTGFPGNLIQTETYIPGSALRGAFLTAISQLGGSADEVGRLAAPEVRFSNGYFVPDWLLQRNEQAMVNNLKQLQSLPMPLTAQEAKATERTTDPKAGPWWAQKAKTTSSEAREIWLANPDTQRDLLLEEHPPQGAKFKRIKTEDYLVGSGEGPWYRVRPAVMTLMRNRVPVARVGRSFDSRRPTATADDLPRTGDLYSIEALAEDQLFLAEIVFDSHRTAQTFCQLAKSFLGGPDSEASIRSWLRLGRGGSPVQVESYAWLEPGDPAACQESSQAPQANPQQNSPQQTATFTLTLLSDLIARAPDLTFYTCLHGAVVAQLAGLDESQLSAVRIDTEVSRWDTRVVYGFNTASGTRRAAALAIQRGSAFRIEGPQDQLQILFKSLSNMESAGRGLGERQEEGFGRFALNHPVHRWPRSETLPQPETSSMIQAPSDLDFMTLEARYRQRREKAIQKVLHTVKDWEIAKAGKMFPSRSQWQYLRHRVEAARSQDQLNQLLQQLQQRAEKLSGIMWKYPVSKNRPLWKVIDQAYKELQEDFYSQQIFLIYLCRWVVVELDRLRREKKRA
ncbi:MAG: hypothetical protein NZ602_15005 [Thermoguttaceae bacterium]|nr:hypothetical protein [Thermoguttaceae bacterium]MDW8037106.1 hypothetical protein [Thermoguttaceae bacterium]